MPIDFSKMKSRTNRVADAQKAVEASSSRSFFDGVFDFSNAPYTPEAWKPDAVATDWELDILAQPIENPKNPLCRTEGMVPGEDWHFHVLVDVHEYFAGTNRDILCLEQFGQTCPGCKAFWETHNAHNKGKGYEDPTRVKNPYSVARRSFMLVRPRKGNPENKVKLFKAGAMSKPTPGFTPMLLAAANSTRGGNAPVDFANPETGSVVIFDTAKGAKQNHFPVMNFGFRPRPAKEGLELWDRSFALDKFLRIPTAEEMEAIMYNAPPEEEAPDQQDPPREPVSQGRRDEYRREEQDAPDTQDTRRQQPPPPPDTDKVVEDGKWAKPETKEAPKQVPGDRTCPEGFEYGVTSEKENKRECRKCPAFDKCFDNKPFDWSKAA